MATLKQKGPKLKLGDLVRIQDEGREGELAVVVEDDGHKEYPWCCMTVTDREEMRVECWPEKYDRIGNVVEMVALGQEAGQLVKAVRKLVRGSSHGG